MGFVDAVNSIMDKRSDILLTERLCKYIEERPDDYGKDNYFHPSQLYYMCPRCEVYRRILPPGVFPEEKINMITRAKFDVGTSLHWWYQNVYFGPMGILHGAWKCVRCGEIHEGFYPKDSIKCKDGRKHRWEYQEPPILSEEWNIIGKCDGILRIEGHKDVVVDLKTSSTTWFNKMKKPWPSAKYQLQVYMWLLGIHQGLLLYIDKSSDGPEPVKEFLIEYSLDTINDVKGKVTSFNMAMDAHRLPECVCGKSRFGVSCAEVEMNSKVEKAVEGWEDGVK